MILFNETADHAKSCGQSLTFLRLCLAEENQKIVYLITNDSPFDSLVQCHLKSLAPDNVVH
jgi:hypothetical protein